MSLQLFSEFSSVLFFLLLFHEISDFIMAGWHCCNKEFSNCYILCGGVTQTQSFTHNKLHRFKGMICVLIFSAVAAIGSGEDGPGHCLPCPSA